MSSTYRYRLLFVGVNASPGGAPLHAAARDARAMSARFTGWGYADPHRHSLLVYEDATTARVLDEIRKTAAEPRVDLLFIYWAGALHAKGRAHLLTTEDGAVDLELLTAAALLARARHRVLVLDTCNLGSAASHLNGLSRYVAPDECLAVLAGTAPDPSTREYHRRGYFTGALLEHLPLEPRGTPPPFDLLDALKTAASMFSSRSRHQPLVSVSGSAAPLHLAPAGRKKVLPFTGRAKPARPASSLPRTHKIAASI